MKNIISFIVAVVIVFSGYYLIAQGTRGEDSKQLAAVISADASADADVRVQSAFGNTPSTVNKCDTSYAQSLFSASRTYNHTRALYCGSVLVNRHANSSDFNIYQNCMIAAAANLVKANQTASTTYASCKSTVASIYTRLSPNSPAARIVTVSPSTVTPSVNLGVFGLSVKNQNATIKSISFGITQNSASTTSPVFSNIRLSVDGLNYGAGAMVAGKVSFTNINIPLSADQWKDLTVLANVAPGNVSNNVTSSTTLIVSGISGIGSNGMPLDLSKASNITGNNTTFLQSGLSVKNASVTSGSVIYGYGTSYGPTGYNVSYSFTLTNTGNTDAYVSKNPASMVAVNKTVASSTLSVVTASPNALAGDTSAAYNIPAGGSRTFTLSGVLMSPGTSGLSAFSITKINYGTSALSTATNAITSGLSALALTRSF